MSDYKREVDRHRTLAGVVAAQGHPDSAKAHRIAAAVYEERERWWIGHGEGCTCHPCVILDRIIAAGEGAAPGDGVAAARRIVAPEAGGSSPLPLTSAPKRPQDYRTGDTLPEGELYVPFSGVAKDRCNRQDACHKWFCTRDPNHADGVHLAADSLRRLCCDPYGDDGKPWVEPPLASGIIIDPSAAAPGRVTLRRDTVLALAADVQQRADAFRPSWSELRDDLDALARLLREDAGA